jgi:hypothetical protein
MCLELRLLFRVLLDVLVLRVHDHALTQYFSFRKHVFRLLLLDLPRVKPVLALAICIVELLLELDRVVALSWFPCEKPEKTWLLNEEVRVDTMVRYNLHNWAIITADSAWLLVFNFVFQLVPNRAALHLLASMNDFLWKIKFGVILLFVLGRITITLIFGGEHIATSAICRPELRHIKLKLTLMYLIVVDFTEF